MSDDAKIPHKKKPGRPRKTPEKPPKPKNGIVSLPKDTDNVVEFLYDKPLIFKKLYQYFKLMAADNIHIIFRTNEIILWGDDHYKKSKIRVRINAECVNHYYCVVDLCISMSCKNPELIMSTIDKSYNSISFISKQGYSQKDIRINLTNDIEIDESHKIELISDYELINDEHVFTDYDYTIKFELPGKYFKKMMSDVRSFSDIITIRQDSFDSALVFEYIKNDKKIKSYHWVKNKDKIKLESKLGPDDNFRISFKIDYVKPISAALLSDTIKIYAHENKPLLFVMYMDGKAVEIRVLTEIIDIRTSNN